MDTEISSISPEEKPDLIDPIEPETETTPEPAAKRRVNWLDWLPIALVIGLVSFGLGMVASYFGFAYPLQGKLNAAKAQIAALDAARANTEQQPAADAPQQVRRYDIPVDDDPGIGPEDAPILIIEFSDYECPFCQKWHAEVWPLIQSKYGDKVRLVYRDFPLFNMHPNATPAAMAANCANDQGRYWEFHSALFSGQYPLSRKSYDAIAADLGLNASTFASCIESEKYKAEIEADYQFAAELGIQSTPTFFVNGLAIVGAQPFEMFDQLITMELNGEIPQN
jgi:protein-disulfide isomerase